MTKKNYIAPNTEMINLGSNGIMQSLNIADPRSTIRDLRKLGIAVHDEWRDTIEGNRFKMYWIDKQRPYEK